MSPDVLGQAFPGDELHHQVDLAPFGEEVGDIH
jgi:hypothetical protein